MNYQDYDTLLKCATKYVVKDCVRFKEAIFELNTIDMLADMGINSKVDRKKELFAILSNGLDFSSNIIENRYNIILKDLNLRKQLLSVLDNHIEYTGSEYNSDKYLLIKNKIYNEYFKNLII